MLLTCGTVTSSIAPGFIIRYTSLINPTRSAICSKQWFDFMISTLFSAKGSKTESRLHTTSVAAVFIMSTPNSSRTFLPPHPRFSIITLPPPPPFFPKRGPPPQILFFPLPPPPPQFSARMCRTNLALCLNISFLASF